MLLRYDAPALGAVDLRFEMDAGALHLGVTVSPGQTLDLAQADAERLRQALAAVIPGPRRVGDRYPTPRPLDLYA